jgi:hypothetical protein
MLHKCNINWQGEIDRVFHYGVNFQINFLLYNIYSSLYLILNLR